MYKGFSIYDFCALMIILSLILSIFLRNLWRFKKSRVFLISLSISAFAIIQNSIYLRITTQPLSQLSSSALFVAYASKFTFLFLMIIIILFSYVYLLSTMGLFNIFKPTFSHYRITLLILFFVPFIFLLLGIPNKWIFTLSNNAEYIPQFGHYVLYGWFIVIFICGIFTSIRQKKYLSREKILDCLILYPLNIISIFHQILHPDYSFIMFVLAITFYVISITTNRPEEFINPMVNARSSSSFYKDTDSIFLTQQEVAHIYIKILNHSQIKKYIGERAYINFLLDVSNKIHQIINKNKSFADLYYLEDSEFCVVVDSYKQRYVKEISYRIAELFYFDYEFLTFKLFPEVRTCVVNIPQDIKQTSYLYYFAKAFHHIIPPIKRPVLYTSISQSSEFQIKNDIENIIKRAIKNDDFEVFYQPILNLTNNKFDSAEAFVRLEDERYGNIAPSIFIPVAELDGVILQIGEIVLKKVLTFISSEQFIKSGLKYIQVNLTLAQCMEKNFAEKVMILLNEYKVSSDKIQFEITEGIEVYNTESITENITKLHKQGILFTLDDYGTGYSNIRQVLSLPIDIVKLDKSFVQDINNKQMRIIVNGTMCMLKNLGKKILVEGIESKESFELFKNWKCTIDNTTDHSYSEISSKKQSRVNGCEYIQGYFLAKPMPKKILIDFLKQE